MKTAYLAGLLVGLSLFVSPARTWSDEPDEPRGLLPDESEFELPHYARGIRLGPNGPRLATGEMPPLSPVRARGFIQGRHPLPALAFGAAPPPPDVRLPGEFERQEAMLLAYTDLAGTYPALFVDLLAELQPRVRVVVLVGEGQSEQLDDLLADHDLGDLKVDRALVPHDTMWARDYGPIVVRRNSGQRIAVDADYLQFGRPLDDAVPPQFATARKLDILPVAMNLEGGNLLSNGAGLLLSTTACLEANIALGRDEQFVRKCLRMCFGGETVFLEPLSGEPTGHIDMFAAFTSPDTVVIGTYDPDDDPENAAILNRNADLLARLTLADGKRLRVVRIPMPPNDDGVWRTYTNVVMANGTLLVPVYRNTDEARERFAIETFRGMLPGWRIVPVDATEVIEAGGALHCLTRNIPAGTAVPAASDRKTGKPSADKGNNVARRRVRATVQPPRG